jgi:hypothetical protein
MIEAATALVKRSKEKSAGFDKRPKKKYTDCANLKY